MKAKGSGPTGFPAGHDKVHLVLWDAISGGNEIKRDTVLLKVQDNHNNLADWVVPNDWTINGGTLKTPMPVDEQAAGPQKEWTGKEEAANLEYNKHNNGDAFSVSAIGNTFTLSFDMAFDPRFVQPDRNNTEFTPDGDEQKLSFVANSGVKLGPIHGNKVYEAAIIDVVAWVDKAGGIESFNDWTRWTAESGSTKNDVVKVPNHVPEKLTRLLHGIKYGELDYTKIRKLDNLNDVVFESPGDAWQDYYHILKRFYDKMKANPPSTMEVKYSGGNQIDIKVNGVLWYRDQSVTVVNSNHHLHLQSHWGSGVSFNSLMKGN